MGFWKRDPSDAAWIETFAALARAQAKLNMDAVETMCEQMLLQDGTDYGVLVQPYTDGSVSARLSPDVPFGRIGYMNVPIERPTEEIHDGPQDRKAP